MAIKDPFLFSTCQTLAHCKRPDIRELCTEIYSTLSSAPAVEQRLKVREISQRLTDVFFIVDLNNE